MTNWFLDAALTISKVCFWPSSSTTITLLFPTDSTLHPIGTLKLLDAGADNQSQSPGLTTTIFNSQLFDFRIFSLVLNLWMYELLTNKYFLSVTIWSRISYLRKGKCNAFVFISQMIETFSFWTNSHQLSLIPFAVT